MNTDVMFSNKSDMWETPHRRIITKKPPPLPYMYMKILFLYKKSLYFTLMARERGGGMILSHDAYVVLLVMAMLIAVTFFIAIIVSYITKSAAIIAQQNAVEDRTRGMYRGKKYAIEVIFFDKRESTLQYENVVGHTYRDNMITIFFSKKYAVYIPLCNVKRLIVRPMLQDVNYDDCDEYEIEPEQIHVHDYQEGDYDIARSRDDGFDDFKGDWK